MIIELSTIGILIAVLIGVKYNQTRKSKLKEKEDILIRVKKRAERRAAEYHSSRMNISNDISVIESFELDNTGPELDDRYDGRGNLTIEQRRIISKVLSNSKKTAYISGTRRAPEADCAFSRSNMHVK